MKGGNPDRWDSLLRLALIAGILMVAGPEILAAIELTVLVELLGATLFITAFRAGLTLLAVDLARAAGTFLAPPLLIAICRRDPNRLEKGQAVATLLGNAIWAFGLVASICAFIRLQWLQA